MTSRDFSRFMGNMASGLTAASLLQLIGLERRRSRSFVIPAIGVFGAGIAVGAGLGVLFAPAAGARVRDEMARRIASLAEDMKVTAKRLEQDGVRRISGVSEERVS